MPHLLHDRAAETEPEIGYAPAVFAGLSAERKSLPCALFYDARGSALFEMITALPEYYPSRTEALILAGAAPEIAARTAPASVLVEFGSGSSRKTELLLEAMPGLAAYAPIDVSRSALANASARLAKRFPTLRIIPIEGDFTAPPSLPPTLARRPRLGFFPGSTIGNFGPLEATALLRKFGDALGPDARLVVGVDLLKDIGVLLPAYNDSAGVTAKFNLNLLARLNREMGADFDLERFVHVALFNADEGRIEMHIESAAAQRVRIGSRAFDFAAGERIHTENSYKYTIAQFHALAAAGGWTAQQVWTDPESLFSLHELSRTR